MIRFFAAFSRAGLSGGITGSRLWKTALDAWEVLQREDAPQLAILDWMMPGMDGIERLSQNPQPRSRRYIDTSYCSQQRMINRM